MGQLFFQDFSACNQICDVADNAVPIMYSTCGGLILHILKNSFHEPAVGYI